MSDIEYLPPDKPGDGNSFSRVISEMNNKPASLHGVCKLCDQSLEFPTEAMGKHILCPSCGGKTALWNEDFGRLIWKHMDARMAELGVQHEENVRRATCPNCGSLDIGIFEPEKPMVFTPMTFTGIMVGAIASSMADSIFPAEKICNGCGFRWPIE
jgi:predicted RNA-binding Zn-ribbon protein involved in translation (DUF1610 family)